MRLDPSQIQVRLLVKSEEQLFQTLMRKHHYLGFNGVLGERLYYVAECNGEWIALLGWGSAALKIQARDRWLNWHSTHREVRLGFIANNWRFLILPEWREPNLASLILAKNLKRLSQDWQNKYGHPVLMVETFVDAGRFRGTCYRADNWICLGETAGFRRTYERYHYHGEKKLIFVKPLYPRAQQVLGCQWTHPLFLPQTARGKIMAKVDTITVFGPGGLFEFSQKLQDGRSAHGKRYRTSGMITAAILAMLAGIRGYKGIFLWISSLDQKTLNELKLWRVPSLSTVRRFLMSVSADELDQWLTEWVLKSKTLSGSALAIDGKTLRGSHDGTEKATQLLSIVDHEDGAVIAQRKIENKTNEIPVAQSLLSELNIQGAVITGDAMHTQDLTATVIARDRNADYVFTVKGNQEGLKQEIKAQLDSCAFSP